MVRKDCSPVRWLRCIRGAIMAAGPFFGYFLWASKETNNNNNNWLTKE